MTTDKKEVFEYIPSESRRDETSADKNRFLSAVN